MNEKNDPPSDMSALVEAIFSESGCLYLSDLHENAYAADVADALTRLNVNAYTPRAWSDTISYILRAEHTASTAEEPCEFLRRELLKRASHTERYV